MVHDNKLSMVSYIFKEDVQQDSYTYPDNKTSHNVILSPEDHYHK